MYSVTKTFWYDGAYKPFLMFRNMPSGVYPMYTVYDSSDGNFTYLSSEELGKFVTAGVPIRDVKLSNFGSINTIDCVCSPTSIYLDKAKNFYNGRPLSDFRLCIDDGMSGALSKTLARYVNEDSEDVLGVIIDTKTGDYVMGCSVVYTDNRIEYVECFNSGVLINFRGNQLSQFVLNRRF